MKYILMPALLLLTACTPVLKELPSEKNSSLSSEGFNNSIQSSVVITDKNAAWKTYTNPDLGYAIDFPAAWDVNTLPSGEAAGFYPPEKSTEAAPPGDSPHSDGLQIIVDEQSLDVYVDSLKESEIDCQKTTSSHLGEYEAVFVQCTSAWDGTIFGHYLVESNGKIFDLSETMEASELQDTFKNMRDSFSLST